jgi:hypothetical protein
LTHSNNWQEWFRVGLQGRTRHKQNKTQTEQDTNRTRHKQNKKQTEQDTNRTRHKQNKTDHDTKYLEGNNHTMIIFHKMKGLGKMMEEGFRDLKEFHLKKLCRLKRTLLILLTMITNGMNNTESLGYNFKSILLLSQSIHPLSSFQ